MSIESLKKAVRNIPDFPIQGIQFKDITTLFQSAILERVIGDPV